MTGNCMSVPVVGAVLSSVFNHLAKSAAMPALPKQQIQPEQLALRDLRKACLQKVRLEIGRLACDVSSRMHSPLPKNKLQILPGFFGVQGA